MTITFQPDGKLIATAGPFVTLSAELPHGTTAGQAERLRTQLEAAAGVQLVVVKEKVRPSKTLNSPPQSATQPARPIIPFVLEQKPEHVQVLFEGPDQWAIFVALLAPLNGVPMKLNMQTVPRDDGTSYGQVHVEITLSAAGQLREQFKDAVKAMTEVSVRFSDEM